MGRTVHLDLDFDMFNMSVDVPLQPIFDWFNGIRERNELSRARDRGEVPLLVTRVMCPVCGAGLHFLESIPTQEGSARACRRCRSTFPLGV